MPNYYDRDKKRYRFTFKRVIGGKEYRTSKLLPSAWGQAEADAYDRQESARIYAVAAGIEKPKPEIAEAIVLYLTHHVPALKNHKAVGQELAHIVPFIEGKYLDELRDVSRSIAAAWLHLKPSTVRNRLAYLKAAVRYAYEKHDLGDKDYTDKMHLPAVSDERQVYIRQNDLKRLLSKVDDTETGAIITLAFYTGLRWRSEILTLKPEQISISENQAWITVTDTKNGRPHMIPVHPEAMNALKSIPFSFSDTYYAVRFRAARRAAGLNHVRMHDQRHSFASALLSLGGSLGEVGRALNHQSNSSTKRYSHLYPERVLELVLRMPSAEKDPPVKYDTPRIMPKKISKS